MNDHYYQAKRTLYLDRFMKAGRGWDHLRLSEPLEYLPTEGESEAQRVRSVYEQELIIMAECEAYFRVAYKVSLRACYDRLIVKSLNSVSSTISPELSTTHTCEPSPRVWSRR
jgi:hypothetical protein